MRVGAKERAEARAMSVKRYDWGVDCMRPEPDGCFVDARDYDALVETLDVVRGLLRSNPNAYASDILEAINKP